MSDQQDRVMKLLDYPSQEPNDFRPVLRVEISCRLIGENDPGLMHDGPRNRNPLLLSTRKLTRPMCSAVGHPHQRQDLCDALSDSPTLLSTQQQRKGHVLFDRKTWDQMKGLKNDAD
jgi:hypothetical protein